jgi:hypothetical protein
LHNLPVYFSKFTMLPCRRAARVGAAMRDAIWRNPALQSARESLQRSAIMAR